MAEDTISTSNKSRITASQINALKQSTKQIQVEQLEISKSLLNIFTDLNKKYTEINKKELEAKKTKEEKLKIAQEEYELALKRAGLNKTEISLISKIKKMRDSSTFSLSKTIKNSKILMGMKRIPILSHGIQMTEDMSNGIESMTKMMLDFGIGTIKMFSKIKQVSKLAFAGDLAGAGSMAGSGLVAGLGGLTASIASLGVVAGLITSIGMGVFALQNIFKFNIGNIAGIWGSMTSQISQKWAVFEIGFANSMKKYSKFFSALFEGISDVILTSMDYGLELVNLFGEAFSAVFGTADENTDALKNTFDALLDIMHLLMPLFRVFIVLVASVTASFAFLAVHIKDMYDWMIKLIDKTGEWVGSLKTAGKFTSFGGLASLALEHGAGESKENNVSQSNNVNITVNGNLDQKAADKIIESQESVWKQGVISLVRLGLGGGF